MSLILGKVQRPLVAVTNFKREKQGPFSRIIPLFSRMEMQLSTFRWPTHWKWRMKNIRSNIIHRPNECAIRANGPQSPYCSKTLCICRMSKHSGKDNLVGRIRSPFGRMALFLRVLFSSQSRISG